MKMIKKSFAVVMALILALSCFAISATAIAAPDYKPDLVNGEIKVTLKADKTIVKSGDKVAIDVFVNSGSQKDMGNFTFMILFNNTQINPFSKVGTEEREFFDVVANYADPNSLINPNFNMTVVNRYLSDADKAYYNQQMSINAKAKSGTGMAGTGWSSDGSKAQLRFYMTVADDVQPGDVIRFGVHEKTFSAQAVMGPAGGTRFPVDKYNLTDSMVTLTVADEATSIINPFKHQIKYYANADKTAVEQFDYRTLAKISAEDFNATFGSEAKAKEMITSIGFVYNKGTTEFNKADAEAFVKANASKPGTNSNATFTMVPVNYISTGFKASGADYAISCLIKNVPAGDKSVNVNAMAYIAYVDNGETKYAFYDTVDQFTFEKVYSAHEADFLATLK